jgi:hypothetical protein
MLIRIHLWRFFGNIYLTIYCPADMRSVCIIKIDILYDYGFLFFDQVIREGFSVCGCLCLSS